MPPHTEQYSDSSSADPPKAGRPPFREFLQARWQLLVLETKEAAQSLTLRVAAIAAAAVAIFFAWALFLVAAGLALHHYLVLRLPEDQPHWAGPAAAGILFLAHLLAALILIGIARKSPTPPRVGWGRGEWEK